MNRPLILSTHLVLIGTVWLFLSNGAAQEKSARNPPLSLEREKEQGYAAMESKRFDIALNHFNRVLSKAPRDVAALYGRGWTQSQLHHHQQAIADFSEAIRLDPDEAELYVGRGLARHGASDYNGLVADMEKAVQLNPDNQPLLDDARSTRIFALVKLGFLILGGVLLCMGIIPIIRVIRLMSASQKTVA